MSVLTGRCRTRVMLEEIGYVSASTRNMNPFSQGSAYQYVDLGPGPNSHTWGAVLLSKVSISMSLSSGSSSSICNDEHQFPIINSTHHLLPSPHGELAPAIHAVLDIFGTPVHVVVAHNGQEETPLDRELQARELARIMADVYPEPIVFLGYVVTKPHAPQRTFSS